MHAVSFHSGLGLDRFHLERYVGDNAAGACRILHCSFILAVCQTDRTCRQYLGNTLAIPAGARFWSKTSMSSKKSSCGFLSKRRASATHALPLTNFPQALCRQSFEWRFHLEQFEHVGVAWSCSDLPTRCGSLESYARRDLSCRCAVANHDMTVY